ncbi:Nucleotidyltransferase [Pelomyxa schiedti]|nr:Nucleotidyltransferase [Pelomyxa schiedti]
MRNISPKSGDPLKTFKCSAHFLLDELMRRLRLLHITPMFEGIRLIGSTAAQIVAGTGRVTVNDLDITIYVDSPYRRFMDILQAEEELIAQLAFDSLGICLNLPEVYDVYFRDSIKVNTSYNNSWSLITVGDDQFTIDIKTVFATVRSYDFSVNSFEIVLDPFFYNDQASTPQVIAESTYGDIDAAQNHLNTRTLVTDQPTLIR